MNNSYKFSVERVRALFPILQGADDNNPLVYLDNAATTQKPQPVIDALVGYYSSTNSNVHRGAHRLADQATQQFEQARDTVARFIHASAREEIVWTRGTTEAINIVAQGLSQWLNPGDEVLVTELEHHSNLVPWQQACLEAGAILRVAPINSAGELLLDSYEALLNEKTKLVAFPHVSNALGTLNPIKELTALAKSVGAWVLIDGAQGIAHEPVDVEDIGCDFYAFSGHKVYGPTGIGVLWGRHSLLADWPVWQTGGEMISSVSYQDAEWNQLPYKFEAGTPNIAGAIGLATALDWFASLDREAVIAHETQLLACATDWISSLKGIRLVGTAAQKAAVLSFEAERGHPADIGFLLDKQGIAIRTGHHCAEPLMQRLGVPGTARASFAIYNTLDDVERLAKGLEKVLEMLNKY